jgi:hypothetical protein
MRTSPIEPSARVILGIFHDVGEQLGSRQDEPDNLGYRANLG